MQINELRDAVQRLSSSREAERGRAESRLRNLSPQDLDDFLSWSSLSESGRRGWNGCLGCSFVFFGMFGTALLAAAIAAAMSGYDRVVQFGQGAVLYLFLAAGTKVLIRRRDISLEANVLRRVQNPACVEQLLVRFFEVSPAVRTCCEGALNRLLPNLKASGHLSPAALSALHRIILAGRGWKLKSETKIKAIKALVQVGDEASLWELEHFCLQRPHGGKDERLYEAAESAIEAIRYRLTVEKQGATLLRPAAFDPAESLLHPASSSLDPGPTALLRPLTNSTGGISEESE